MGRNPLYRAPAARQRHAFPVAPTAGTSVFVLSLRRLEHEYSLAAELEPAWAAKPIALSRHEGRTILVLADPGAEPLDCVLERDRLKQHQAQPLDPVRLLPLAIGMAAALGRVHCRARYIKTPGLRTCSSQLTQAAT